MLKLVVIAIFAPLLIGTPASAASPINGSNSPTALAGKVNGELSIGAELALATPSCAVARAAAPSLQLMIAAAANDGVKLGTNECYRPLAGQVSVSKAYTNAGNSACAATPATSGGKVVGTSFHGWGKAVDFTMNGINFSSVQYRWLKANAAKFGWNHPAWAEPGGSACPEAWHWEWVGDGGTQGAETVRADVAALLPTANGTGYTSVTGIGDTHVAGTAMSYGTIATASGLNWPVLGAATTPDRKGYWMTGTDGGVFSFGNAAFYGSTGNIRLNQPVVNMEGTNGAGYWLVATDGGVFSFGDAKFFGSTGNIGLNKPIVGMAKTPSGNGYWLVASDGGVFSFGDAKFFGSTGAIKLNKPIVAMAATVTGNGYWLLASDGGVFAFGDAKYFGSTGANPPDQPVRDILPTQSGNGYWIVSAAGQIYSFGDATYYGGV